MAKILLVEDDQNLSEIYNARLSAEGYEVLDAANGEDALAIAAKEKPDLVISDVMMPRVSGFEMLDILRHTDGMQAVKIIMLTALGQDNDRSKASELGADRYLVKSQVTLEDIISAAKELLGDSPAPSAVEPAASPTVSAVEAPPAPTSDAQSATPSPASEPSSQLTEPESASPTFPTPSPAPDPISPTPDPVQAPTNLSSFSSDPVADDSSLNTTTVDSSTTTPLATASPSSTDFAAPTTNPSEASELASAEPIAREEAELQNQLNNSALANSPEPEPEPEPAAIDNVPPAPSAPAIEPLTTDASSAPPLAPQAEPAALEQQPITPSPETEQPTAAPNHDDVLAAALKELEGENNPPQAHISPPISTSDNPSPNGANGISGHKSIQPLGVETAEKPNINELLEKENLSSQSPQPLSSPQIEPTSSSQPAAPEAETPPNSPSEQPRPETPGNISL